MIAFTCSVSEPEPYLQYAEPGIRLAAEHGSAVLPFAAVGSIGRSYNVLLDAAAAHDDLEALIIVHPHAEIADPELCEKLRAAFADPDVAAVGCAGATGVRSIAWWDGDVSSGSVVHRYTEHCGGELPGYAWRTTAPAPAEVEALDGFFLALSPWAVRNVRFEERLVFRYGFDVDYCLQLRLAGRKVVVVDLRLIFHRSLEVIKDLDLWIDSHVAFARKWEQQLLGNGAAVTDWKQRARRAEAEREAARAISYSKRLGFDARVESLERKLEETTATLSWRVTAPLRRMNSWRRGRVELRRRVAGG